MARYQVDSEMIQRDDMTRNVIARRHTFWALELALPNYLFFHRLQSVFWGSLPAFSLLVFSSSNFFSVFSLSLRSSPLLCSSALMASRMPTTDCAFLAAYKNAPYGQIR